MTVAQTLRRVRLGVIILLIVVRPTALGALGTAGAGLTQSGDTVDVNYDAAQLEVVGDALRIKSGGITGVELAVGAVLLSGSDVQGVLPVANGGTGGTVAPPKKYSGTGPPGSAASWTVVQGVHGCAVGVIAAEHVDRS